MKRKQIPNRKDKKEINVYLVCRWVDDTAAWTVWWTDLAQSYNWISHFRAKYSSSLFWQTVRALSHKRWRCGVKASWGKKYQFLWESEWICWNHWFSCHYSDSIHLIPSRTVSGHFDGVRDPVRQHLLKKKSRRTRLRLKLKSQTLKIIQVGVKEEQPLDFATSCLWHELSTKLNIENPLKVSETSQYIKPKCWRSLQTCTQP